MSRAVKLPNVKVPLVAFFQPIVGVQTGTMVGVEALARLVDGSKDSAPRDVLAALDLDGLFALFCQTLKDGIKLCRDLGPDHAKVYISINIDAPVALRPDFVDVVRFILDSADFDPKRVAVEILEGKAIGDFGGMTAAIQALRALGLSIALDDIGSAYASLSNIKELPVDILKLDQTFSRGLAQRPHDLQFVWSLIALARGLDKTLVVEGVETMDVYDALSILGVDFVQGYAIARPMASAAIPGWAANYKAPPASKTPKSMLGAYASHLTVVETCRILMRQPLPFVWTPESEDPHACEIGRYFDREGIHDSACGCSHKQFHRVLTRYATHRTEWEAAARDFRDTMATAMSASNAVATPVKRIRKAG